MDKTDITGWLTLQLARFYQPLSQGQDISPAQLLKLEGKIEYLLEQQLLDWAQVQQQVDAQYQQVFGDKPPAVHWQWCKSDNTMRLPYQMQAAPVKR